MCRVRIPCGLRSLQATIASGGLSIEASFEASFEFFSVCRQVHVQRHCEQQMSASRQHFMTCAHHTTIVIIVQEIIVCVCAFSTASSTNCSGTKFAPRFASHHGCLATTSAAVVMTANKKCMITTYLQKRPQIRLQARARFLKALRNGAHVIVERRVVSIINFPVGESDSRHDGLYSAL